MEHPKDVVRRGYDVAALRYDEWSGAETKYQEWVQELLTRLEPGARVLDVGCGSGVPVARDLVAAGHRVTGVDISAVQVARAREAVPRGEFIEADITSLSFPPAVFDAVVSLYALIHIPVEEQPQLLADIGGWLRPGGWFFCVAGQTAWTGTESDWLGGGAAMWWSQADADTYRTWLTDAGFSISEQAFVPEGDSGHSLFWCRRGAVGQL